MTFRLIRDDDRAHVRAMMIETFAPITWMKRADEFYGPFNGLDWRERFGRRVDPLLDRGIVLLGEDDGAIQAAAAGSYDSASGTGVVDFLAVDSRYQGLGLGREMLDGMLRHLAGLGATTATLECLSDNETALALYRSAGWNEIATSIRFFRRLDGILK
jgi:ribosomal protein S18 acetylase RimI-like enzyme